MRRHFAAAMMVALCVQASASAATADVNGISLHYEASGAGPPLLLLHGFGSCAAEWQTIAAALAKSHRVIAIDMRGHGQSTNPSAKFTHRQSAEDVRALMDSLSIPKAQVMGFSSGGMTLLQLAIKYPDRVSKAIVISATTHFPDQAREILRGSSVDTMPPPVREAYQRCAARGDAQVRELVAQFSSFADSHDDMNLTPADLAKIKAPTLIIHGDRDPFFPVTIPVAMYGAIPGSALWIVPNGEHAPMAGAEPSVFLTVVDDYLSR
jgi:pimeloyl-ACP methyl ester carboxylesterase